MRTLSANALAEISKKLGTEPIKIIGAEFTGNGSTMYFADRDITLDSGNFKIEGKILEVGEIETVLNVTNSTIASVTVKLDDTDGTIKSEILDKHDIHKKFCTLYQHFGSLNASSDKFRLLRGQINTPIEWNEADRTVTFTIVSIIEEREIGFSPEEAQFDYLGYDQVGQVWPLVFGTPLHVPAVLANAAEANGANLNETMCMVDPLIAWKKNNLISFWTAMELIRQYFNAVIGAAKEIAPPPFEILNDFLIAIRKERELFIQVNALLILINKQKDVVKKLPGDRIEIAKLQFLENQLKPLAFKLNVIRIIKFELEQNAVLAVTEYKIKKEAYNRVAEAVNTQSQIYAQYLDLVALECQQLRCVKSCYSVTNGGTFPFGEETRVRIQNVDFRVTFNSETQMCVNYGPMPRYSNLVCYPASVLECNGPYSNLGDFLIDDPSVNLTGCWLYVTSKYDPTHRHLIKVVNQVGNRITFQLVQGTNNQGNTGGGHVKSKTQILYDLAATGSTNVDLESSGLVPGTGYDMCNTFSPDTLAALGDLVNTLNQEEINVIMTLQCLIPKDGAFDAFFFLSPTPRDVFTIIGEDVGEIIEAAGTILPNWLNDSSIYMDEIPGESFWSASPGDSILNAERPCQLWIANVVPGTVKAVMAYRTDYISKRRTLTPVPSYYYTKNESDTLNSLVNNPLTVTSITLKFPLSSLQNEGWEDQLYVTSQSSIGKNVVDVLEYLITTFTDKTFDASSFNTAKNKFRDIHGNELYPVNFALLDRRNAFEVLKEIAWQARCALVLNEGENKFYIKYLAEEPTSVRTFTESDIKNLSLMFDSTESLITRMVCNYKTDYLPLIGNSKPLQLILRHNVKKYWLHQAEFNFYIYNDVSLIEKSATFWLIRYCNSWKKVSFTSFQTQLAIEPLDCITLSFSTNYVANTAVKGIVESAKHDPVTNNTEFVVWLPVRFGEMSKYKFAWPANVDAVEEFPTYLEIKKQYAGGSGIGIGIQGSLPGCS